MVKVSDINRTREPHLATTSDERWSTSISTLFGVSRVGVQSSLGMYIQDFIIRINMHVRHILLLLLSFQQRRRIRNKRPSIGVA